MIKIEIIYALPQKQYVEVLQVPQGTTVEQALLKSVKLQPIFPEMVVDSAQVGIFGKHVKVSQVLVANDRIEIYRPLLVDPKEARRNRVRQNKK